MQGEPEGSTSRIFSVCSLRCLHALRKELGYTGYICPGP